MLPTIIHQYWDRPRPPDDVADRMATWPRRNVGWEHRLWDDASGTAFLEERFGSEAARCFKAIVHPAMRADLLRVAILRVFGGVYVDADAKCRQPIGEFVGGQNTLLYVGKGAGPRLSNAFMAFEPRHPFIGKVWTAMLKNVTRRTHGNISKMTGPHLLNGVWFDRVSEEVRKSVRLIPLQQSKPYFRLSAKLSYHLEEGHWKGLQRTDPLVDFDRAAATADTTE